jgi:hypothetical protein
VPAGWAGGSGNARSRHCDSRRSINTSSTSQSATMFWLITAWALLPPMPPMPTTAMLSTSLGA